MAGGQARMSGLQEWLPGAREAARGHVIRPTNLTAYRVRARLSEAVRVLEAVQAELDRADGAYGADRGVTTTDAIRSTVADALERP